MEENVNIMSKSSVRFVKGIFHKSKFLSWQVCCSMNWLNRANKCSHLQNSYRRRTFEIRCSHKTKRSQPKWFRVNEVRRNGDKGKWCISNWFDSLEKEFDFLLGIFCDFLLEFNEKVFFIRIWWKSIYWFKISFGEKTRKNTIHWSRFYDSNKSRNNKTNNFQWISQNAIPWNSTRQKRNSK